MANENGDSVSNFLLGALIGGVIGVLFAPQEGSKTREILKLIAEDTLKDFQDSAEKNSLKARIIAEDAAEKFQKTATQVKKKVENLKDNAEEVVRDIKPKTAKRRISKRSRSK